VYANNELKLGDIDVYGFDYDYTVACYNDDLNQLIYDLGRANLMKYNKACSFFTLTWWLGGNLYITIPHPVSHNMLLVISVKYNCRWVMCKII